MRRMGRTFLFFRLAVMVWCLMLVLLMFQVSVYAHPPSSVKMIYNDVSGVLSVTVEHDSDDLTLHYIERMDITQNGEQQDLVAFEWDENEQGLVATYNMSVMDGDEIVVEAWCSIQGSMMETYVVGGTGAGDSTPGFDCIVFLGGILVFFIVRKRWLSKT